MWSDSKPLLTRPTRTILLLLPAMVVLACLPLLAAVPWKSSPEPGKNDAFTPALMREDTTVGAWYWGNDRDDSLAVADVDGDGVPEIIAVGPNTWYVLAWEPETRTYVHRHFHVIEERPKGVSTQIHRFATGDVDGDGDLEVVLMLWKPKLLVFDARTGTLEGAQDLGTASYDTLAVGDLAAAPGDEIAALNRERLCVFRFGTPAPIWEVELLGGVALAIGNLDTDPAMEIAVATRQGSPGIVIDCAMQRAEWAYADGFGSAVETGDIDGDGLEEIITIVEDWSGEYAAIDGDLREKKWSGTMRRPYVVRTADTNGSGIDEVVIADSADNGPELHIVDGTNGSVLQSYGAVSAQMAFWDLGDLDADCRTEFVWTGSGSINVADDPIGLEDWRNLETAPGSFTFADLDADGQTEIVRASQGVVEGISGGMVVVADLHHNRNEYLSSSVRYRAGTSRVIAAAQLDADSAVEYLVDSSAFGDCQITAYDGITHDPQWQTDIPGQSEVTSLAAGDLDDDGIDEVLLGTDDEHVSVLNGSDGSMRWQSPYLYDACLGIEIADVDLDGTKEFLWVDYAALHVHDGVTHVEEQVRPEDGGLAMDVGDIDGDLDPDIIVGDDQGALTALDGQTMAVLFQETVSMGAINELRIVDIDGDAVMEIVALQRPRFEDPILRILSAETRSELWQYAFCSYAWNLEVGDLDDDGCLEISVLTNAGIRVFEYAQSGADVDPPVWDAAPGVQSAVPMVPSSCCASVDLDWGTATDGSSPPVEYRVYRETVSGFTPGPANLIAQTGFTSHRDRQVLSGENYYYVVRAVDLMGNEEANLVEARVTTSGKEVPVKPIIASVVDPLACALDGVEITFRYPGSATTIRFDLRVDGAPVATDVVSPLSYAPGDDLVHDYRIVAVDLECPLITESDPVSGIDSGEPLEPPVILSVNDPNRCAADGIEIIFSHTGFAASGSYRLVVDGEVAADSVASPVQYTPGDSLPHTYAIVATEDGCPRSVDSLSQEFADGDGFPQPPVIDAVEDLYPCWSGPIRVRFSHEGFAGPGHYELRRDGALLASPVADGQLFDAADGIEHGYVVRAIDDTCGLSSDSGEFRHAKGASCTVGEPRLYLTKAETNAVQMVWDPAPGDVASYNAYAGTLDSLHQGGVYDHVRRLDDAFYPDSPGVFDGCNVANGPGTTARVSNLPIEKGLYFLLVAVDTAGKEGPYGRLRNGLDRHDPLVDPRPPGVFCP